MTINQRRLRHQHRELLRTLGRDIAQLREDAGRSQATVAAVAGLSRSHLSRIEAGTAGPSLEALMAIGTALGCDLSIRLFPNTGPRIRDWIQAAIGEGLLGIVHRRWRRHLEVAVYRPVRGVIDLVLADQSAHQAVASEIHSQLRRLEQLLRWSTQKADALAEVPEYAGMRVSRLLIVRNTAAMRETFGAAERALATAYPARSNDALASLTGEAPWPGNAVLWANVEHGRATILDDPPRGIAVGR